MSWFALLWIKNFERENSSGAKTPQSFGSVKFDKSLRCEDIGCPPKIETIPEELAEDDICKECTSGGYTYEYMMYKGEILQLLLDRSWLECAEACDKNGACQVFTYNTKYKKCYLEKLYGGGDGPPPFYKKNFVHSRPCGPAGKNKCEPVECNTCSDMGYTTEKQRYRGATIRTITQTEKECAKECDLEADCLAMVYDKNRNQCTLQGSETGEPNSLKSYAHLSYHRRKCS